MSLTIQRMKTLLFAAFGFLSISLAFSQTSDFDVTRVSTYKENVDNETIRFAEFKSGEEPSESESFDVLTSLDPKSNSEWVLVDEQVDPIGDIHRRYKRYLLGHEMIHDQVILHVRKGKIFRLNSAIRPCRIDHLPVSNITKEQAELTARPKSDELTFMVDERVPTELVLFYSNEWRWAWKVDAYALNVKSRKEVFIDVESGEILKHFEKLHETDVPSSAQSIYHGNVSFFSSYDGNVYRLQEEARNIKTGDYNESWLFANKTDFIKNSNDWNDSEMRQLGAFDVHYGGGLTYDFYKNTYNRNSYDNAFAPVEMYVNPNSYFYGNNAFWNGKELVFGGGDGYNFKAFATLEIIGHEFTHAVVEHTAGLIYESESGALNESIADIMGQGVERMYQPGNMNYLIGDQNALVANGHFRDMSNPKSKSHPAYYKGEYWESDLENDNGGVHTNSGVLNYWFYLLTVGKTGINEKNQSFDVGKVDYKKVQDLVYFSLVNYLTPNSDYEEMKEVTLLLAKDYFGGCSYEYKQVQKAWYAVGLLTEIEENTTADFYPSVFETCDVNTSILFNNTSRLATEFIWDFGDGNTSYIESPSHVYAAPGIYTITLIANGPAECGEADTLVLTNRVKVNSSSPIDQACSPTTHGLSGGYGIYGVRMGDINENYSSTFGYVDYSCEKAWEVNEGKVYDITLVSGSSSAPEKRYLAWIDLNNDGVFGANEKCLDQIVESNSFKGEIIIPRLGSNYGVRRMRISVNLSSESNPCTSNNYSDFKDYQVLIHPTEEAPIADFGVSDRILVPMQSISVMDSSLNCPTNYYWTMEGANYSSSTLKNPVIYYSEPGVYAIRLHVSNSFGKDEIVKERVVIVKDQLIMCQDTDVTTYAADIYDSGGPNGAYGPNENCRINITMLCAVDARLSVEEYDFGEDDVLTMIFGYNSGTLSKGGGTVGLGGTTSTAALEFKSNGFDQKQGYKVTIMGTVLPAPPAITFKDDFSGDSIARLAVNSYNFTFNDPTVYDSVRVLSDNYSFTYTKDYLASLEYYWSYGAFIPRVPIKRNGYQEITLEAFYCGDKTTTTRIVYSDYIKSDSPNAIKVYPNPSDGNFFIENNLLNPLTQNSLLDYSGKKIMDIPGATELATTKIYSGNLAAGIYFLQLQNSDAEISRMIRLVVR